MCLTGYKTDLFITLLFWREREKKKRKFFSFLLPFVAWLENTHRKGNKGNSGFSEAVCQLSVFSSISSKIDNRIKPGSKHESRCASGGAESIRDGMAEAHLRFLQLSLKCIASSSAKQKNVHTQKSSNLTLNNTMTIQNDQYKRAVS